MRPPDFRDVPAITAWLGDYDVAKNLATAPYPYREEDAEALVARAIEARARRGPTSRTAPRGGCSIGHCGLRLKDGRFRLGYWLGKPFGARAMPARRPDGCLGFGFDELKAPA